MRPRRRRRGGVVGRRGAERAGRQVAHGAHRRRCSRFSSPSRWRSRPSGGRGASSPTSWSGTDQGEIAAACVAGALLADGWRHDRVPAGRAHEAHQRQGRDGARPRLSIEDAEAEIAGFAGQLGVAVSNGTRSHGAVRGPGYPGSGPDEARSSRRVLPPAQGRRGGPSHADGPAARGARVPARGGGAPGGKDSDPLDRDGADADRRGTDREVLGRQRPPAGPVRAGGPSGGCSRRDARSSSK